MKIKMKIQIHNDFKGYKNMKLSYRILPSVFKVIKYNFLFEMNFLCKINVLCRFLFVLNKKIVVFQRKPF